MALWSDAHIKEAAAALAAVRPGLPVAPTLILLGQARGESDFGYAIPVPPDGSSSYNWGAIYADGDLGRVPFTDAVEGKVGAARNSSPEVGARQFASLIEGSYSPAMELAYAGDLWGYARALWRLGPGSKRPAYYSGFPPGDKRGTTPAGVPKGSPLDAWYRVGAYAQFISGGAKKVASVLGLPASWISIAPPPAPGDLVAFGPQGTPSLPGTPSSSSSGSGILVLAFAIGAAVLASKGT